MAPPSDTHLLSSESGDSRSVETGGPRKPGYLESCHFHSIVGLLHIMSSSVRFLSYPNAEVQTRVSGFISGWTDGYPLEHGLELRE